MIDDQTETVQDVPAPETATPKRSRKKAGFIAGGAALLIAVAGAVITPQVVQANQLSKHEELTAEINEVITDRAETLVSIDAASALVVKQDARVRTIASKLATLSKSSDQTIPKEQTKQLASAADTLTESLGEEKSELGDATQSLVTQLEEGVAAAKEADKVAAEAAKEADTDVPEKSAPSDYLSLDIAGASELMGLTAEPVAFEPEDVINKAAIEAAEALLAEATVSLQGHNDTLVDQEQRIADIEQTLVAALPAVQGAAEVAPTKAKAFVKTYKKASKEAKEKVTSTANAAADSALADDANTVEVVSLLEKYISAANGAKKSHDKAVAAEKKKAAQAAAAAAGQSSYVDPGTGQWVDNSGAGNWNNSGGGDWGNNSGGGGNWTPPANNGGGGSSGGGGGGGGSSSGGGGGGSSSGGGGNSGGGSSGGGTVCGPQPPGHYHGGGYANGCPTWVPNGSGGADDW